MCGKIEKTGNPQIRNVRVVCSIHIIGSKQIKGLHGFPGKPFLLALHGHHTFSKKILSHFPGQRHLSRMIGHASH